MKTNTSKRKGSNFERQIAKELSKLMFNDETILFRDATSGGRKVSYVGDIVPVKQMRSMDDFPFMIELKHGYNNNISTFYTQKLTRDWIIKAMSETTPEQHILLLIIKHNYKPTFILISKKLTCLTWTIAINVENKVYYGYMYKDLLSTNIIDFYTDLGIKIKELC